MESSTMLEETRLKWIVENWVSILDLSSLLEAIESFPLSVFFAIDKQIIWNIALISSSFLFNNS